MFLFLTAYLFLGLVYLWAVKKDFQYRIIHHGTQRYFLDYLVLAVTLTLFAIALRAYRPESVTRSMLILLPGLCYLVLKILYSVLPSLPLILVGLTVMVNIFAHWVWFDTDLLTVFHPSEQTFSELVIHVFPDEVTVLSLG